ncbi:MAG: transglutaminase domain-containing protein [Tahibacter sp.]
MRALQKLCGLLLAGLCCFVDVPIAIAQEPEPTATIIASIDAGQFAQAEAVIAKALSAPGLSAARMADLEFQRERMRRIRLDFGLSREELLAKVLLQIPDLNNDKFEEWDAHGLFERQVIDGQLRYFNRAPSNLFRLSGEARAMRPVQKAFVDNPMESANAHHREVRDAALVTGRDSVAPRRLRVTQSLTVEADALPAGKTVRAWIPYPRAIAGQQEDIRYVASVPRRKQIAPESTLQRTVFLEQVAVRGKPTRFQISYEVTIYARYHAVDPALVLPTPEKPELAADLAERPPHIQFSQSMRLLSRQIVGDEKNPWRIAQKLFAAVDEIPWAGAREYSTISNIGEYALHAGHADCGQQTLLLMTLLRLNGIPSRWQSGMVWSDGTYNNLHDWGQLYIAPYGWIPMDVTAGRLHSDDPAIAGFYLGGLDAYRIAFNDDYGRDFIPAKRYVRSETVDLQRGEAEWDGGNLYFDQWDYAFEWKVLPLVHGRSKQ